MKYDHLLGVMMKMEGADLREVLRRGLVNHSFRRRGKLCLVPVTAIHVG